MSFPRRIVLASGNPGKVQEIARIFADLEIDVVPQDEFGIDSPEETGATFVENALQKARHVAERTGLPAMADDSGIAVDALGGRPGVRSARYAGAYASDAENLQKLLDETADLPDEARGAAFHCAAVVVFPGDEYEPCIEEGVWRGTLLRTPRGDGGFGYDPIFLDPALGRTGAELDRAEKNAVSHRGKAFRQLKGRLREILAER